MTNNKTDKVENTTKKIDAVRPADFQTAEHRYRRFDTTVSGSLGVKDLENPALWVNIARQVKMFDEIRVIADDHSFVATLLVVFVQGSDARMKVLSGTELDEEASGDMPEGKYVVKLCGTKKWCIINNETGERVKENIPKQSKAQQELEEYLTALNS